MRAFAAVFAREVHARRLVFPVALAAGFVPILGSSLFYGWSSPNAADGRVLVGLVAAASLSTAFALLLGASMIAGETAEKRISFFFTRPIPAAAIWGGKVLAAVFVTLASALITLAPALLTGPGTTRGLWGFNPGLGTTLLGAFALAVLLVLGSHAAVTVGRLRSPWVALDLVLGAALAVLAATFLRTLLRDSASPFLDVPNTLEIAGCTLAAAFFLALILGSLVQVADGRTDARRAHGAFSAVFFAIFGAGVLLVGGYAWWCASAKATDLESVGGGLQTAPRGPWLAASGPLEAGRGGGTFLFDPAGGRSIRVRSWGVVFSPDGTRAAWGEPRYGLFERKDNRADIVVADLASGRVVATGLEIPGWADLAFSPGGNRLAVRYDRTVETYDVSSPGNPKQLAVFQVEGWRRGLAFSGEDTVLVFPRTQNARRQGLAGAQLEITELSLSSKKSLVTGRLDAGALPFLRLTPDGRFFVGTRRLSEDAFAAQALTLHDGRTGALVATLAEDLRTPQLRFLTGGRIAVAGIAGARAGIIFFEGEKGFGFPTPRPIDLGPAKRLVLGGEVAPGRIAVCLLPFEENFPASSRAAKIAIVDVATGAVSPGPDGLVPADRYAWWFTQILPPAGAGSPASALFLDAGGRLVRLDPATGERKVLLGRK
jgi:hypothetical protein